MSPDVLLQIERLDSSHLKNEFDCGNHGLNDFVRKYANQNARKRVSTTYVAVERGDKIVLAYYSISVGALACGVLSDEETGKLPRYPMPVVKLGRLAVDKSVQNQGIGRILLIDALEKILSVAEKVAVYAVEVDALNDAAKRFYTRYGFQPLKDDDLHMYLGPVHTF